MFITLGVFQHAPAMNLAQSTTSVIQCLEPAPVKIDTRDIPATPARYREYRL